MATPTKIYPQSATTPGTISDMTLRFPKEMVTQTLWAQIAEMGWLPYVIEQPAMQQPKAPVRKRTYREIAESLPVPEFFKELEGCIPPFTEEEIAADPRLEAILKR